MPQVERKGWDAVIEDRRTPGFDVARAFAIAAMILVNFDVIMEAHSGPMPWIATVVEFFYGRAAATFVMLAGVSLSLMACRRKSSVAAQPLGSYLMRRCVLLLITGLMLSLWWAADILHFYALFIACGIGLMWCSDACLRRVTVITIALSIPVSACLTVAYDLSDQFPGVNRFGWGGWLLLDFWTSRYYSFLPWVSFFMVGLLVGRKAVSNLVFFRRYAVVGALGCAGVEIFSSVMIGWAESADLGIPGNVWLTLIRSEVFPVTPLFIFSAGASSIAVIGFAVAVSTAPGMNLFSAPAAAFGRLSMTMYMAHLVLAEIISDRLDAMSHYVTTLHVVFAAILFCCAGIGFAVTWLRYFRRGPLEMLSHQFSMGRYRRPYMSLPRPGAVGKEGP
jgi:uncharacterized membrane protein YeiB